MLVASLRDVIAQQSAEIESLQTKLKSTTGEGQQVSGIEFFTSMISGANYLFALLQLTQMTALRRQIETLSVDLKSSEDKRKEVEKEHEDLLVLLDEMSSKRRMDKARLREAGLAVSEDEGDEEDEDE